MKQKLIIFLMILASTVAILYFFAMTHRTVWNTYKDPSGKYIVIITYNTYLSFIPMSIGSSSDKKGFIKILDDKNNDLGEIPLPMLQLARLEWTKEGADVFLLGSWNFKKNYCYYWAENGNDKIIVKGKASDIVE